MKKYSLRSIILVVLIFISTPIHSSESLEVSNEFIKIILNNTDAKGRFSLETTEGDPSNLSDNLQDLIYGQPIPWTSYTTLLINDIPVIFGNEGPRLKKRTKKDFTYTNIDYQVVTSNSLYSASSYEKLDISQKLSFFRNPNTNVKDAMLIEYTIYNHDTITHNIGMRLMLDTKLGPNDGSPFRMGNDVIMDEIKVNQADLYDYWLTFDQLNSPNIIAQGLLQDPLSQLTPPNYIQLANWGTLVDDPWNQDYQAGRSFVRTGEMQKDTALGLYYSPTELAPNEQLTYKTVYGLGGLQLAPGELSIGLTGPKEIPSQMKNPILIMGYIVNTGGFDAHNVIARFDIPDSLQVLKGHTITTFNKLTAQEHIQIPLLVAFKKTVLPHDLELKLSVTSETFEENNIAHQINILSKPSIEIEAPTKIALQNKHYIFSSTIKNTSKASLSDVIVSLSTPQSTTMAPFEMQDKELSSLGPFESKTFHWVLSSPLNEDNESLILKTSSNETDAIRHQTSFYSLDSLFSKLKLNKSNATVNDYISIDVWGDENEVFKDQLWSLHFDPSYLKYIRFSQYPDLDTQSNRFLLTKSSQKITIQGLSRSNSTSSQKLATFHFKVLKSGTSMISLFLNNQLSSKLSLTSQEEDLN